MSQPEEAPQENAERPAEKTPEEPSKQFYRRKVWEHLDKNKLGLFPRPAYGRIPNFKGSNEAASKLLDLSAFKDAKTIEVNPDKPQESARILVLENNKTLYVPVPRLKAGLLKLITVPENANKNQIRQTISRRGIEQNGKTIGIDEKIEIDLLVVGSVAVSKKGHRIGKGRGYADLEYAILKEMGAVSDDTVIVTIVHESQVFEELPEELFGEHDVPIDFILTPTEVIEVERRLARPKGVIWSLLSKRRLDLMPVLQALKEKFDGDGKDTTLKEVDTDVESYEPRPRQNKFPRFRRRRARSEEGQTDGGEAAVRQPRRYVRTRRFFGRRRPKSEESATKENGDTSGPENNATQPSPKRERGSSDRSGRARRPYRPYRRYQYDFSLMVTNIERNVHVRDLKKALDERGVKPNEITWRGYRGFCYLHYAKPNNGNKTEVVVDDVIEILRTLKIGDDGAEAKLGVKVMEPVTRIETTDVTAV